MISSFVSVDKTKNFWTLYQCIHRILKTVNLLFLIYQYFSAVIVVGLRGVVANVLNYEIVECEFEF